MRQNTTLGSDIWRGQLSIPGTATLDTTWYKLIAAAFAANGRTISTPSNSTQLISMRVYGVDATGVNHPAFIVANPRAVGTAVTITPAAILATDFTTHGQFVAAGVEWVASPTTGDLNSYVQSTIAGAITVNVEVIW